MKTVRFIHTADLHLDSPFLGLKHLPSQLFRRIQESTFQALTKIVDAAIEKKVDFIVIVGDLFDGEDRSIKAQSQLRNELARLKEHEIAVFITYGNHDHLAGNWLQLDMPDHVYTFNDHVEVIPYVTKSGATVHLYGFSYRKRHLFKRKITEYEKKAGADFHIGLLHGQYEGGSELHQPYAPFTKNELLEKNMDYWALGHVHKREILHTDPYIVYPGNIQGRHRKEEGKKGCYAVTLNEQGQTTLEWIDTAKVYWKKVAIEATEKMSFTQFYLSCQKAIADQHEQPNESVLFELTIDQAYHLSADIRRKIDNGELLEALQTEAQLDEHEAFVWPYRITYELVMKEEAIDEQFIQMLNETVKELKQEEQLQMAIADLYSHSYAGRYLSIDELNKEEILHRARQLIIDQLTRKG